MDRMSAHNALTIYDGIVYIYMQMQMFMQKQKNEKNENTKTANEIRQTIII